MKKIISIFIVFIILISTVLTAPAYAVAVEIIGGSYVAYAVLAAALAAAGYTVATNQINPEVFQGILDSPNSELIKALIGGTSILATAKGQVFFNWTSAQWSVFNEWVSNYLVPGLITVPGNNTGALIVQGSEFNPNLISSYYEPYIVTSNSNFGFQIGSLTFVTTGTSSIWLKLNLEDDVYFSLNNTSWYSSGVPKVVFASPLLLQYGSNSGYGVVIGAGITTNNTIATSLSEVAGVRESKVFNISANQLYINGTRYIVEYLSNTIKVKVANTNRYINVAPTVNFDKTYSSLVEWMTDVLNTGALVGDWSGIGDDVINPADNDQEVGIDAYPNWRVGTGIDALPDELDVGTSIDIPLNPYIETDLGPDVIDPYVDFTPWDTTTVPPDDVIPDVRINPPADVTANPDTPWADDETYPLDYPTDTTTEDLPPGNNPNPDPSSNDKTNRLKLGPLLLSKFPFCLPWDLQHALKVLIAPAEAPVFTIPFVNQRLGINESLTIDLSFADRLAQVTRWFLSALWVVILILITSKIIWK